MAGGRRFWAHNRRIAFIISPLVHVISRTDYTQVCTYSRPRFSHSPASLRACSLFELNLMTPDAITNGNGIMYLPTALMGIYHFLHSRYLILFAQKISSFTFTLFIFTNYWSELFEQIFFFFFYTEDVICN